MGAACASPCSHSCRHGEGKKDAEEADHPEDLAKTILADDLAVVRCADAVPCEFVGALRFSKCDPEHLQLAWNHESPGEEAPRCVEEQEALKPPRKLEPERNGVRVERIYDLFDPVSRKVTTLELTDEDRVIHERRGAKGVASLDESTLSSFSSHSSDPDCSPLLPQDVLAVAAVVHSRWGILTGKLLHYKVLALTTLGNKYIDKTRAAKETKGGLWKRVESRAKKVLVQGRALVRRVTAEPDCVDGGWDPEDLLSFLFTTEFIDTLMILAKAATKLFSVQPILAETSVPCRVFGDIHGQLRDLLLFFRAFGWPGDASSPAFVFNGDFVDRGSHQLEVVGLLFALKIAMPHKIWLVRGNHEDRGMNERYGFKAACLKQLGAEFGEKTFDLYEEAFSQLPLACLVSQRVLCVHGGIGRGRWDLNSLRALTRPITDKLWSDQRYSWVYNILWSDPIEDDVAAEGVVFGVHESPRASSSVTFGWDVTATFCARNGLGLIVRSHQSKQEGLGFDVMHDHRLVRVFSARDYEGGGNDGAVLLITEGPAPAEDGGQPTLLVRPQVLPSVDKTGGSRKPFRR